MDVYGGAGPMVSVVMPVRNEARHVAATLKALASQTYPASRLEIVVVDGRSEDATRAIVTSFAERHPHLQIHLLDNQDRSIPAGMNLGIAAATGDVILRMDGHTVPTPDYVEASLEALARSGAGVVGGCITPVGDTPFGEAVAIAHSSGLGAGDAAFHHATDAQFTDTAYLGAFPRSVLKGVGGYDPSMLRNEDYELCVRLRAAGHRVYLDPAIRSQYRPRGTPAELVRQYAAYGWWKVETLRRHPRSLRWRQALPALFVGTLLASTVLTPFVGWAAIVLIATLSSYALAHVLAGVVMRRAGRFTPRKPIPEPRWRASLALQFRTHAAIMLMHVAWGAGFLANLVTFGRAARRDSPACVP